MVVAFERERLNLLPAHCNEWVKLTRSVEPIEEPEIEAAIAELYGWFELPTPVVFWCQSPWQLAMAPDILQKILQTGSDIHKTNRLQLLESPIWQTVWSLIDSQCDSAILSTLRERTLGKDMARRSKPGKFASKDSLTRNWVAFSAGEPDSLPMGVWEKLTPTLCGAQHELTNDLRLFAKAHLSGPDMDLIRSRYDQNFRSRSITRTARGRMENLARDVLANEFSNLTSLNPNAHIQRTPPHRLSHFLNLQGAEADLLGNFSEPFLSALNNIWWGAWSVDWLPMVEFIRDVCGLELPEKPARDLNRFLKLARLGFAYSFFGPVCFVSDRPLQLKFDEQNRFHSESGPAVCFADGYQIYSWHGTVVNKRIVDEPESISLVDIRAERNIEVRRVLIERFGSGRFIAESKATKIHEDQYGTLYMQELNGDEPLVMVKVRNSTPEPDGSYKDYYLRVPPTVLTARAAVAWSFGVHDPEQYNPSVET
jgi:hypothetical protein